MDLEKNVTNLFYKSSIYIMTIGIESKFAPQLLEKIEKNEMDQHSLMKLAKCMVLNDGRHRTRCVI